MVKFQFLFLFLLTSSIWGHWFKKAEAQSPTQLGDIQFTCGQSFNSQKKQYIYTTFAWNDKHKKPIIYWNNEALSDAGFDPQTRCEKVSPRFQEAYTKKNLRFLTHGKINGQPVICTASQAGGECKTLLLTLLPENDPLATLEQLSDVFLGYSSSPLQQSSEDPVTEVGDRVYVKVDIEEFLNSQ